MNEAKFTLTPQNARGVMRSIWDNLNGWFENGNLEITIRPHKSKRSIEQNRRLWKIYGEMTDYQNRLQSWAAGEFGIIWEF